MACGSEPSADFLAIADQMRLDEIENAFDKTEAEGPIQVDVYYHALAADQQEMDGITVRTPSSIFAFRLQLRSPWLIIFFTLGDNRTRISNNKPVF